jgi:hypothetical protein
MYIYREVAPRSVCRLSAPRLLFRLMVWVWIQRVRGFDVKHISSKIEKMRKQFFIIMWSCARVWLRNKCDFFTCRSVCPADNHISSGRGHECAYHNNKNTHTPTRPLIKPLVYELIDCYVTKKNSNKITLKLVYIMHYIYINIYSIFLEICRPTVTTQSTLETYAIPQSFQHLDKIIYIFDAETMMTITIIIMIQLLCACMICTIHHWYSEYFRHEIIDREAKLLFLKRCYQ